MPTHRDLLCELELADLTVEELQAIRAPLMRARRRVLAGKVVPLRMARGSAPAYPPDPTVAELFAELDRHAGYAAWGGRPPDRT